MIFASVYLLSALGLSILVTFAYFLIFFGIIAIVGWLIAIFLSVIIRFIRFEI